MKPHIHSQAKRKNKRVGAWSVALHSAASLCSHTVQDCKEGNDTVQNVLVSAMSTIRTPPTDTCNDHPYLDSSSAELSSQGIQGPSRLTVIITQQHQFKQAQDLSVLHMVNRGFKQVQCFLPSLFPFLPYPHSFLPPSFPSFNPVPQHRPYSSSQVMAVNLGPEHCIVNSQMSHLILGLEAGMGGEACSTEEFQKHFRGPYNLLGHFNSGLPAGLCVPVEAPPQSLAS